MELLLENAVQVGFADKFVLELHILTTDRKTARGPRFIFCHIFMTAVSILLAPNVTVIVNNLLFLTKTQQ